MTDKNSPDNARNFDDIDVPTYDQNSGGSSPVSSSFGNRAQPQQVGGAPETVSFDSAARPQQDRTPETTQFAQTSEDYSQPVRPANETQDLGTTQPTQQFDSNTYAAPVAVAEGEPGPTPEEQKAAELRAKRDERKADPRRGTLDFGLLFARLALAAYLIVSGVATFFGLGGSEGLSGLETSFADYAMPQVLAIAVPTLQLIAGVFLLLGLVTPLASMLALVVTGFTALHELAQSAAGLNPFGWPDSVWLSLVLFLLAIALQFTGPGVISLDFGRSWARRPLASSWVFVVIGIAVLVVAWWFGAGVNPLN